MRRKTQFTHLARRYWVNGEKTWCGMKGHFFGTDRYQEATCMKCRRNYRKEGMKK